MQSGHVLFYRVWMQGPVAMPPEMFSMGGDEDGQLGRMVKGMALNCRDIPLFHATYVLSPLGATNAVSRGTVRKKSQELA